MKLLFVPKDKAEDLMNLAIDEIDSIELEEIKSELKKIDENFSIKEINIGEGADWIMILAILNGITTVFLLGDKIDKGIDGWVKIGKRINVILSKSDRVYLDKESASFIVVDYLSEKYQISSLKLLMESQVPIKDLSGMLLDRTSSDFIATPYSIYFMTFEINEHILLSLSIRSDGLVAEHHNFDRNDFIPF